MILAILCAALWSVVGTPAAACSANQAPPPVAPAIAPSVTIRVLSRDGVPLPGAEVGSLSHYGVSTDTAPAASFGFFAEEDGPALITDASGAVSIADKLLFYSEGQGERPSPIIARTTDRSLIGLADVKRSDLGGTIDVQLQPACRVTVRTRCSGLEKLGRRLPWANVYIHWRGVRPMACNSIDGTHEFLLPPGEYTLAAYGSETYNSRPSLIINPGDREKTIETDLPPNRVALLTGQPAPELAQIKDWKNGGPITLAELRGKVVLLDFWGYWCGPCVESMPDLIALHEKYKDHGLVIIAVHDDSAATLAEVDQRLASVREIIWSGRDLPFIVALDGGGEVKVEGRDATARGATTAAYGINVFPTQLLIDKDGILVGRAGGERTAEQIERLLGLRE